MRARGAKLPSMKRSRLLWLVVPVLVLFAACDSSKGTAADDTRSPQESAAPFGELSPDAPEPSPPFEEGTVTLTGDEGSVEVRVQIASESSQLQIGLMGRTSLPEDAGMVFLFPGRYEGGFWMKDTLIPLSIAFARDGKIVDILDMQPCEAEPCTIYTPDTAYDTALEVNLGSFERWNIKIGDSLTVS